MKDSEQRPPRLSLAFVGWRSEPDGRVTVMCDAFDDWDRRWEVAVNSPDRASAIAALKAVGLHGLSKQRTSQFAPTEDLCKLAALRAGEVVFVPGDIE